MAAVQLWAADTAEPWAAVQQGLDSAWQDNVSQTLQQLNRWYVDALPAAIANRAPDRYMKASELVQLVEWKLKYGKWRPRLLDYAKAAAEQQVQEASRKAFSLLLSSSTACSNAVKQQPAEVAAAAAAPGGRQKRKQQPQVPSAAGKRARTAAAPADADAPGLQDNGTYTAASAAGQPSPASVKAALDALTVLKGVGPGTASAALAAADGSGSTPYMGDEALQAACGGRDYTPKAYLQLLEALRAKADWLRRQDPGGGWTAVLVERCLHAAALQEIGASAAHKAAAVPAKFGRGAKASSNTGGKAGRACAAAK